MNKISVIAILLLSFLSLVITAQIPNAGFESWTSTKGYDVPVNWDNLNDITAPVNVFTCMKDTNWDTGSAYLKLVSDSVKNTGVLPGIAVCGTIDKSTLKPKSGFAYHERPAMLTGKRQFMGNRDDHGYIIVCFTKWNPLSHKRDTIGYGKETLEGMEMAWTDFIIPISFSASSSPDSCVIVFSASGATPLQHSYLYIDDLSFKGTASVNKQNERGETFHLFPNPVVNKLQLDLTGIKSEIKLMQITDIQGNCLIKITAAACDHVDVSGLSGGIYFIQIQTPQNTFIQKFCKL
jgi:hypothetical protein